MNANAQEEETDELPGTGQGIRRRDGLYYARLRVPACEADIEFALHGISSSRQARETCAMLEARFAAVAGV